MKKLTCWRWRIKKCLIWMVTCIHFSNGENMKFYLVTSYDGHKIILLTHMKNVSVGINAMISARPAGRLSICGKNFNIAIFSDTINTISKCQNLHDGTSH